MSSAVSPFTLQEQLDNANLQVKIMEKSLSKAEQDVKDLKYFKKESIVLLDVRRKEVESLQRQIETLVQNNLRKEIELKKFYEKRISQLESENFQLNKIKNSEFAAPQAATLNTSSFNRNHEDPSARRDPTTIKTKRAVVHLTRINQTTGAITKLKTSNDLGTKQLNSIFKKPRLGMTAAAGTASLMKHLGPNFAGITNCRIRLKKCDLHNGFGGSDKVNPLAHHSDEDPNRATATNGGQIESSTTVPKAANADFRIRLGKYNLRSLKVSK